MTDFESNLAKRCKCRGTERILKNPLHFNCRDSCHVQNYMTKCFQSYKYDACRTGRVEISYGDETG